MKKTVSFFLLACLLLSSVSFMVSCSDGEGDSIPGGYSARSYSKISLSMADGTEGVSEGSVRDGEEGASDTDNGKKTPEPGVLTASAWNDNTYYNDWKALFVKGQTEKEDGKFVSRVEDNWSLSSLERVRVCVKNGETPVPGAVVLCLDGDGKTCFSARTDAAGNAYLFPDNDAGTVSVRIGETIETVPYTEENRDLSVDVSETGAAVNTVELMFVVDVTGSMGDEISYLKAELGDVIAKAVAGLGGVRINLAFLFYRDEEDDPEFVYSDFTDVTEKKEYEKAQKVLAAQYADGGGDYPEAVDEALMMAVGKQWSANTTKILFHVLDAPPHDKQKNKNTFSSAVKTAAEKGIRICPIVASGIDSLTEYLTRTEAIFTGGTFVFLTDDSGVGNSHYDPGLPNAVVEKLNLLMVRLIKGYHTGTFEAPVHWSESNE